MRTCLSFEFNDAYQITHSLHDKYYNNTDSSKGNRYLQWLKNTQKDIYIKETVSVVDDMVNLK